MRFPPEEFVIPDFGIHVFPVADIGRKHPAHHPVLIPGDLSPIVFLTVCTAGRKRILAAHDVHAILVAAWVQAGRWSVGRYVILLDHLHLFCSPATKEVTPHTKWVQFWKALASRRWPRPAEQPVWQVDSWDTQLRWKDSYRAKWEYVAGNPVRHGLAQRADDWPFQGELHVLPWHDR